MNPGLFQVWIKPLQAALSGEELQLQAPNEFVVNWVRERLLEDIAQAAATVLGFKPAIVVSATPLATGEAEARPEPLPMLAPARQAPAPDALVRQVGLPLRGRDALGASRSWRFSFDDFVVGPSNELAYVAAKSLCTETMPSDQLFISAAPGLGKTHLLQAVGRYLSEMSNLDRVRVEYLTGEEFARHMVFALRAREIERFKARFRDGVDILLLEDVHFFQGKERMQDELLATIKALRSKGAKVVYSSSFLPRELKTLDSQLASRFGASFLAVIDKPDFLTRKRILEHKARTFQVVLPESVTDMLAERIHADVRQLESCLQNLILKARLLNQRISLDLAMEVLTHYAIADNIVTIDRIIDFICTSFDLTPKQLCSKSRQRQIVVARNAAFFLARQHTGLSLKDIGDRFNRKHTTVLKGITNVERELSQDTPLGRQLTNTMDLLGRFDTDKTLRPAASL